MLTRFELYRRGVEDIGGQVLEEDVAAALHRNEMTEPGGVEPRSATVERRRTSTRAPTGAPRQPSSVSISSV
jgi:hypothetical protein